MRRYRDDALNQVAFPLGGIGTGTLWLRGWGPFGCAELWGRPDKANPLRRSGFQLVTDVGTVALEGPPPPAVALAAAGTGRDTQRLGLGRRRFGRAEFAGSFPTATLRLSDAAVPVRAQVEAWSPFVPGHADDSSVPAALFEWVMSNHGDQTLEVVLRLELELRGGDDDSLEIRCSRGGTRRTIRVELGDVEAWDAVLVDVPLTLAPATWIETQFAICWHHPDPEVPRHYESRWSDASEVADWLERHGKRLRRATFAFRDVLHDSTLPAEAIDAAASQASILRTPTCARLADGTFWGWEGCWADAGCCEGTCSHVWNYAQALPALFGSLERSVREADLAHNMSPDGHLQFRTPLPPGRRPPDRDSPAAVDGQCGGIVRLYQQWRATADRVWLSQMWPRAKRALDFAAAEWDADGDGLLEGSQHNTYDVDWVGPNPLGQLWYLAALRAGEELARAVRDDAAAAGYRDRFERGRRRTEMELWGDGFYVQRSPDPAAPHQLGPGCLSDQLVGQWLATRCGLGDLVGRARIGETLRSIVAHNWKRDIGVHRSEERVYAVAGESGLVNATWPTGGRPAKPFPFATEVWSGVEYQVAAHLIAEGMLDEGMRIVRGVRARYDGRRRNPYDEVECGHHYARAMASWALIDALSGFRWSAPQGRLSWAPKVNAQDFRCVFSTGDAWGVVWQKRDARGAWRGGMHLMGGDLTLTEVVAGFPGGTQRYDPPVSLKAGSRVELG